MARRKLTSLPDRQARFYLAAQRLFRENADWLDFREFVFGRNSPLFDGVRKKSDVLETPLYEELEKMWLELGVRQGMVRDPRRS